ncbi:MAG: putative sensor domain DACNV-containing protein, partial [Longimicrobiaceae bacterium]
MRQTGYPAARTVAPIVAEHLAAHLAAARERGEADLAPQPDEEAVAAMVDLAFWASLQREEGRAPRISLAWVPPGCGPHAMVFERALDADPRGLARVAPAVERPGIHLG